MPSLQDSVVIFILALMLFGPKKLPQLARQLGKLMAEFRRASNEFRMQMEDELRIEEQKEHEAKVASLPGPGEGEGVTAPAPIAESGELKMMPPSTGLPVESISTGNDFGGLGTVSFGDPEQSVHEAENSILPPAHDTYGISSEEPAEEAAAPQHHEGEHATHA